MDALAPYVPRLVADWLADEPARLRHGVDGTLVFADISGFTALTERLAAGGKAGAEEMGELLNGVFDPLLTAAYDHGANLLKWGGDAVLLLFDGAEHASDAVAAAAAMQQVMRGLGRLPTSRGVVRLGMSIGVAGGPVEFALVGRRHRELLVLGPVATAVTRMEQAAQRGQVVLAPATAAALPAGSLGEPVGQDGGVLLRRAPQVPDRPNRQTTRAGVDLTRALCTQLADHLLDGRSEYEHRTAAIGFLELAGTDELLAAAGPQVLAAELDLALTMVQDAAHANDVTFLSSDVTPGGVKIILTAGVPVGAGDDETRLLSTQRQLLSAVAAAGVRLTARGGATRGGVFAGDYGPFYRRCYSITGDVVNLAARLMTRAAPGQLLATVEVAAASRTRFGLTELEPFAVKGKAQPVRAVAVGEVSTDAAPRDGGGPGAGGAVLVGREAELRTLRSRARTALGGAGAVLEVVGEPGIGKTTLLHALADRVEAEVLWADGDLYSRAVPYAAFHQLLRGTLGLAPDATGDAHGQLAETVTEVVADLAPDYLPWLPLIGLVAGADFPTTAEVEALDPEVRRGRLEKVTSGLLGTILASPTVFVFNDVQFMDEASVALIDRLGADCPGRPWLILRATRPDGPAPPEAEHVHRLALRPLSTADGTALAGAALADNRLAPHQLQRLVDRAGGNPLFLEQLVAGVRSGADPDALPDTVEGVIAARIDRLPPAQRRWLRAVSVLGVEFDLDWVSPLLADSDLGRVDHQTVAEFVAPRGEGRLQFAHHLIRQTAYEGLPYRRRRDLHERAAEVLERHGADAGLLSLHCVRGGLYAAGWKHARIAGDEARRTYAPAVAADCYGYAVEAARQLNDVDGDALAEVYEALAEVRLDLGEREAAFAALARARSLVRTDPLRLAALQVKTADHRQQAGQYRAALAQLTAVRRLLVGQQSWDARRLEARAAELTALIGYRQNRYESAMRWSAQAIEMAERVDDRRLAAGARTLHAVTAAIARRPWTASDFETAIELFTAERDRRATALTYIRFGMAAFFAHDFGLATNLYALAEENYRAAGREEDAHISAVNRVETMIEMRQYTSAEQVLPASIDYFRATSARSFLAFALLLMGRVFLASGRPEAARTAFEEAQSIGVQLAEHQTVDDARQYLSELESDRRSPP